MRAVLVTGTRETSYKMWHRVKVVLRGIDADLVIHGSATGVDDAAKAWAQDRRHTYPLALPAQWERHGDSAGPIRNGHMVSLAVALSECGWEVTVEAFPGPTSKGTWNCVRRAQEAGLTVNVHRFEEEEAE